jgi:DNA-directed RNA polymerase subunit alpha
MVTPRIEPVAESRNYGKFEISPLERGYGITLGNALRRALLSALDGAAVTSVRITDVMHEFSNIPGVREDVIQVMLQLKQVRVKLHDVDTARMHLEVQGEGVVTAADIMAPPEVEIINPDLYLFTMDNGAGMMDMELSVEAAGAILRPMTAASGCRSASCRWTPSSAPSNGSTGR